MKKATKKAGLPHENIVWRPVFSVIHSFFFIKEIGKFCSDKNIFWHKKKSHDGSILIFVGFDFVCSGRKTVSLRFSKSAVHIQIFS